MLDRFLVLPLLLFAPYAHAENVKWEQFTHGSGKWTKYFYTAPSGIECEVGTQPDKPTTVQAVAHKPDKVSREDTWITGGKVTAGPPNGPFHFHTDIANDLFAQQCAGRLVRFLPASASSSAICM